ncbi:MAG: hypothetical protein Q9170_006112 [Blastenia crenularia]
MDELLSDTTQYTTDITKVSSPYIKYDTFPESYKLQSEFLTDLNYDFNSTHDSQLRKIHDRAQADILTYDGLHTLLHNHTLALSRNDANSVQDKEMIYLLYTNLETLIRATSGHIATLRKVAQRALWQHILLLTNLAHRFIPPTQANMLPIPVELDSMFRPGQHITITWDPDMTEDDWGVNAMSEVTNAAFGYNWDIENGRSASNSAVVACYKDDLKQNPSHYAQPKS